MSDSVPTIAETFGKRMTERLNQLGKRPVWLASEADLSAASVFAYASGKRSPGLDAADAIARALNVPLDWLTGRQEELS